MAGKGYRDPRGRGGYQPRRHGLPTMFFDLAGHLMIGLEHLLKGGVAGGRGAIVRHFD
jgi:hypothetical protein